VPCITTQSNAVWIKDTAVAITHAVVSVPEHGAGPARRYVCFESANPEAVWIDTLRITGTRNVAELIALIGWIAIPGVGTAPALGHHDWRTIVIDTVWLWRALTVQIVTNHQTVRATSNSLLWRVTIRVPTLFVYCAFALTETVIIPFRRTAPATRHLKIVGKIAKTVVAVQIINGLCANKCK
jgi:hypothetical protein